MTAVNRDMNALPPELKLLLSCARARASADNDVAISRLLEDGIDWKQFTSLAVRCGIANLAGQSLLRVGSGRVPNDVLVPLQAATDQFRRRNAGLLDELGRVVEALRNEHIDAISFGGPILAIRAYGDLGLRPFGHLDVLVEESKMAAAVSVSRRLGYDSGNALSASRSELIWRLEGRQCLSRKGVDADLCVHARVTPLSWALDIDYPGLWRRAQPSILREHALLTLDIEDELVHSALRTARASRRSLKSLCDVAALVDSHPNVNWAASVELAQRQGCRRVLLSTLHLAAQYFGATIPAFVTAAAEADPVVARIESRLVARWANETRGRARDTSSIIDLMMLHDRAAQRARYVVRTLLLPKPHHVAFIGLPWTLVFAYAPIKLSWNLANTLVKTPYRWLRSRSGRLRDSIAASRLGLAILRRRFRGEV